MPKSLLVFMLTALPNYWQPLWGQAPGVGVEPSHKPKQQSNLAGDNAHSAQVGTQSSPLIVETHERPKSEKETAEAQKDKEHASHVERWTLFFAGAAAVFTGLLIWVGWRGVDAALRTLRTIEAQETLQANSQRAWVLVDKVNEPDISCDTPEELSALAGIPFFGCSLKIFGSTPARIVSAGVRFHLQSKKRGVTPPVPDLPEEPNYKFGVERADYIPVGYVKAPDQSFVIQRPLEDGALSKEQVSLIEGHVIFVCAYGFVNYLDFSERPRETRFCYIYRVSKLNWIAKDTGKNMYPSKFAVGGPPAYNRFT